MTDGDYIRVVVAPSLRVLFSSINSSTNTYYVRIYLPVITAGNSPRLSQIITLTGEYVQAYSLNNVMNINVNVDFPKGISAGFDSEFFNFPEDFEGFNFSTLYSEYDNVVLELYISEVSVGFGLS